MSEVIQWSGGSFTLHARLRRAQPQLVRSQDRLTCQQVIQEGKTACFKARGTRSRCVPSVDSMVSQRAMQSSRTKALIESTRKKGQKVIKWAINPQKWNDCVWSKNYPQSVLVHWQSVFALSVHILISREQNNTKQKGHVMARQLSHWQFFQTIPTTVVGLCFNVEVKKWPCVFSLKCPNNITVATFLTSLFLACSKACSTPSRCVPSIDNMVSQRAGQSSVTKALIESTRKRGQKVMKCTHRSIR